jgi:hypothetical protein
METSENLVDVQRTTRRYITEDRTLQIIWYDTDRIENTASIISSIVACIFVSIVTF